MIPAELQKNAEWCVWKREIRGGKPTKVPYNPITGERAETNNPATFGSFELADERYTTEDYDGVGIRVSNGFSAVDIDHCIENGVLSDLAMSIINQLQSYTEYSPSKTGVRIIFKVASDYHYDSETYYLKNPHNGVEVYVCGATNRFVTITGNTAYGYPVRDVTDDLARVLDEYMTRPVKQRVQSVPITNTAPANLSDEQVIFKASANGKFRALFEGDLSDYNDDHSSADLALCNILAFWTGRDYDAIDRIFRQSGLFRDKWLREDYRSETIRKAIADCTEIYTPYTDTHTHTDTAGQTIFDRLGVPNLHTGDFIVTSTAVFTETDDKKTGDKKTDIVTSTPIVPTRIMVNADTGVHKIELAFRKNGTRRTTIQDRETIASKNKIVSLANVGVDVTTATAGKLVDYLNTLQRLNEIPEVTSISHLGWVDSKFLPYDDGVVFDGEASDRKLFNAIKSHGSESAWREHVSRIRENKPLRMTMAASFASPLIERCGALPFVFHLWGTTGGGKAQPLDTKIITPNGYTFMGDLRIGDEVIGGDGKPHKVVGIYPQGEKDVYELTFADGRKTRCCREHLWNVTTKTRRAHKRGYTTMSLGEMLERGIMSGKGFNFKVPLCKPVQYEPVPELPVSPYLLGALIGDGCTTLRPKEDGSKILYFSNTEQDVIAKVDAELQKIGAVMRENKSNVQYTISRCQDLKDSIVRLGLDVKSVDKFIPGIYKTARVEDRTALLCGLVDTDGHVEKNGSVSFSTKSERLAYDVCELAHSLGYKAHVKCSVRRRNGTNEYRVSISANSGVFSSGKHSGRMAAAIESRNRTEDTTAMAIVSVEPVGKSMCQCIMVDSDEHTYLCDDFIVTHNTVALKTAMSIWGKPDLGELVYTMNMTDNAMMNTAGILYSLPFAGDELQLVKSQYGYDRLIMRVTEGIDRGRMKYDAKVAQRTWKNSFIFTGEEPCTDYRSGGGTKNRVIEVNADDGVVNHGGETVAVISENYGHAGRTFIDYAKTQNLRHRYRELYSTVSGVTDKQALAATMILLGDALACECLFTQETPLVWSDISEFFYNDEDVSTAERSKEYILGWITQNRNKFDASNYSECWGVLNGKSICIIDHILFDALNEKGFSFDAVKRDWVRSGFLVRSTSGRIKDRKFINGSRPYCVELQL